MRARLLAAGLVAASTACTRTPPEPASSSRTPSADSTVTVASTRTTAAMPVVEAPREKRCIREMSTEPAKPAAPAGDKCPKDPAPQTFPTATLGLPEAKGALRSVTVELATTRDQTSRGLMYRRSMPEDRGMLFDLHDRKPQAFWMRNTCIPLDMLFIEDDGLIVGILEQVPVMNDEERTVGCPSRYVLELNAGFSRKHGLVPGQKVKLP